jgi:hypothetical protein
MRIIKGLREKGKKEVLELLEEKPVVCMDSFYADDGMRLFFKETLKNAYHCASIQLYPANIAPPNTQKLKKIIWKTCKETLVKEWEKPIDIKFQTVLSTGKLSEDTDILQLIKEQDKKEGIKTRLLIVSGFNIIDDPKKWLEYIKNQKDHFKFIFYDYPEWWENSITKSEFREYDIKYSEYTLQPYSREDKKNKKTIKLRNTFRNNN